MIAFLIQLIFNLLPDSRLYKFKSFLLRIRGVKVGKNVRIISSVKIKIKNLSIGENSFIGYETMLVGGDSIIHIGKNVDIAPRCLLVTGTHKIGNSSHRAGEGYSKDIFIGDGTWICANSTIIGGTKIGKGCIIGAGSVVREDIDDNFLVAGVPAKIIKKLPFTE